MNKGFTIVELLSVIVILGLLIIIVTPTYDTVSDNIKLRNYNSRKTAIKSQVISFVEDYAKDLVYGSNNENKKICFTPKFLIQNGIITSDSNKDEYIKNDYNNAEYKNEVYIKIEYNIEKFKLKATTIDEEKIEDCDKIDKEIFE